MDNKKDNLELYTKSGEIRKRKPKKPIMYFTQETEDAIIEYLKTEDPVKRNKIFNEKINYAFYKLSENIIHTFKFYYTEVNSLEELKHELVTVMLEKLHRYQQSQGKAYSYFGTIIKRYLIVYNKKNYKKLKEKADVDEIDTDKTITQSLSNSFSEPNLNDIQTLSINEFIEYVETNIDIIFPKPKEKKIAEAILEIFRKRHSLDILSKKALYIYVHEMADVPTPLITLIIKKLKGIYKKILNKRLEIGV